MLLLEKVDLASARGGVCVTVTVGCCEGEETDLVVVGVLEESMVYFLMSLADEVVY